MGVNKERKSTEFWIIAAYMVCNIIACWWWELSGLRFPFQVGLNNSVFLCVISIRYLLVICKEKRIPKPEVIDIAVIMLAVFAIISTILSVNIENSLWGTFTRDEGIYALITYYLLFSVHQKSVTVLRKSVYFSCFCSWAFFHAL